LYDVNFLLLAIIFSKRKEILIFVLGKGQRGSEGVNAPSPKTPTYNFLF